MNKAYSLFEVKSFNDEQRVISGIATTPQTDLADDIVEPHGATFKLPIKLLYQHDRDQPIGDVIKAEVRNEGIFIEAQLHKIPESGRLKDRLDEAWQSLKYGVMRGLSIGFKPLEFEPIKGSNWGRRIKKWTWLELSAVTIPANQDASILAVKHAAVDFTPGDSGLHLSGATDAKIEPAGVTAKTYSVIAKEKPMAKLTIAERIANLEATRAADVAAIEAINQKVADESRTKDQTEQQSFDDLFAKVEGIDRELNDCRKMQKINVAQAKPVDGSSPSAAELTTTRSNPIVSVKSQVPAENLLPRAVICKLAAHLHKCDAIALAKQHYSDTPEVEMFLKAAVAAGTTTTTGWAAELIYANNLSSAFIEYLWGQTVLSKIPGFQRVPFNVRIPRQTGAVVSQWVGEGVSKPVGKLTFDTITLRWAKCANIVLFTQELARFSSPSIETIVRNTLANAIATFIDKQFFDPSVTAVSNVSPASITNGAANDPASGTTIDALINDVKQAFAHFNLFNIPLQGLVWVMEPANAVAISMLRTSLGQPAFPTVTETGGTLMGFPVFVTPNLPAGEIVLMDPSHIFIADEGGITVDVSTEASVQADSAPATPPTGVVSLWQQNMVGIRAERYITWARGIDAAVYYITSATYGGVATAH